MNGQHTLAGAYAMDALDDRDRRRFERHLRRCDACRQEVHGLRETAARLGTAAASPAPPDLKASVLAAARQTRQRPPQVHSRRLLLTVAIPVTAAAMVAAVLAGISLSQINGNGSASPMIAMVLTASDAHMMTGHVAGGGNASVVMSHREQALVFSAAGLPDSAGYQLWLVGPSGHRLAGTLAVGAHGMAGPVVATGLRPGDHLMLMAEPSGSAVLDLRL
jgi:anti-sigma-K factor RskA